MNPNEAYGGPFGSLASPNTKTCSSIGAEVDPNARALAGSVSHCASSFWYWLPQSPTVLRVSDAGWLSRPANPVNLEPGRAGNVNRANQTDKANRAADEDSYVNRATGQPFSFEPGEDGEPDTGVLNPATGRHKYEPGNRTLASRTGRPGEPGKTVEPGN